MALNTTLESLQNEVLSLRNELATKNKILDAIPNPVFVKDKTLKYNYCNASFAKMLGQEKKDILNASVNDIASDELAKEYNQADLNLMKRGGTQVYDSKVHYANKGIKDVVFHKATINDEKKEPIGIVGVVTDITVRKQQALELLASTVKYEQLNETKNQLFSIIAHDLKNFLFGISGLSEMILDSYLELGAEQILKQIKMINRSANSSVELLADLLSWAKNQTGQIAFEPEALQLSLKADHSLELIKMIAEAKNIKLENNINSNIYVLADKNMLKTVFRNLITNAIKFSNRNSKVTINAKLIENNVEISIMDQGIGMNNNTLDNLFKVGIKTTRPGTSNEKGSGLGLILCKDFIEKNAGKIWAESEENKGSIFYFSLPLAHKE